MSPGIGQSYIAQARYPVYQMSLLLEGQTSLLPPPPAGTEPVPAVNKFMPFQTVLAKEMQFEVSRGESVWILKHYLGKMFPWGLCGVSSYLACPVASLYPSSYLARFQTWGSTGGALRQRPQPGFVGIQL